MTDLFFDTAIKVNTFIFGLKTYAGQDVFGTIVTSRASLLSTYESASWVPSLEEVLVNDLFI